MKPPPGSRSVALTGLGALLVLGLATAGALSYHRDAQGEGAPAAPVSTLSADPGEPAASVQAQAPVAAPSVEERSPPSPEPAAPTPEPAAAPTTLDLDEPAAPSARPRGSLPHQTEPAVRTEPAVKVPDVDLAAGPPDETKIRKHLEPKVWSGNASRTEIHLLKTICTHQGDRPCRDRAAALLKR